MGRATDGGGAGGGMAGAVEASGAPVSGGLGAELGAGETALAVTLAVTASAGDALSEGGGAEEDTIVADSGPAGPVDGVDEKIRR